MDCYRDVFSRDPAEVESLFEKRVKPDWTGELETTMMTSPWHGRIFERLNGGVMRGWIVPKKSGEYSFIQIVNTSTMKFMLSTDASAANLKEVKLVPGKLFGDVHIVQKSKTETEKVIDKAAYNPVPIRLEKGKRYAFRLYAVAGEKCEPPRFEWACSYDTSDKEVDIDDFQLDSAGDGEEDFGTAVGLKATAIREPIPSNCLIPDAEGDWAEPMEFASTPVSTEGEEPDGLSRENLAVNLYAMRDYLDFARKEKASRSQGSEAPGLQGSKAQSLQGSPVKVPYARLPVTGKNLTFEVKTAGDYRLWIRYKFRKGYNVYMNMNLFRQDDPYTVVMHQLFGRGVTKYGSCTDDYPAPQIKDIPETTKTGYRWECSHKMIHLEPGVYTAVIDHGWGVALNTEINFNGVVIDGDPMREPAEKDEIRAAEYGEHELSADADEHASLLKDNGLFERWRTAFIKKLEAPYYHDYDMGWLASRVYFDPDLNAIGIPCEIAALKRTDALGFHGGAGVDASRVGDEDIGFWRCADPFGIFHRFTPPAAESKIDKLVKFGNYKWAFTPIDAKEVNRAEHAFEAMAGEVRSELVLVRNNTDKPIVIEPQAQSDLKVSVRTVAYALAGNGFWTPKILINRKQVVLPPHQNTGLWLTIDCRGATEGAHKVSLSFADRHVDWNISLKGTIEGDEPIIIYPWCSPFPRESCWAAFQDIGINMIGYVPYCNKKRMEKYGIKYLKSVPFEDGVENAVAREREKGLGPEDYIFHAASEPGIEGLAAVIETCDKIHTAEPRAIVWMNGGVGASASNYESGYKELLGKLDAFCPYWRSLVGCADDEPGRAYRNAGKLRLVYATPSYPDNDDQIDVCNQYIDLARIASEQNRNGFGPHTMRTSITEDEAYMMHPISTFFPGDHGRTILSRNMEALREGARRWRVSRR